MASALRSHVMNIMDWDLNTSRQTIENQELPLCGACLIAKTSQKMYNGSSIFRRDVAAFIFILSFEHNSHENI